mmetsp:Transcript_42370/g.65031  ORF Transcript_42370/g.65031 Transcript_42370/m.65031 type:complete len:187 (-) Transcript_42370:186-746(-)
MVCPVCRTGNSYGENGDSPTLKIKNCGFVNSGWAIKGILKRNKDSKIYSEGRTYDTKLYTFKECDYRTIWYSLDIIVNRLEGKTAWKNLPSARVENDDSKLDSNGLEVSGQPSLGPVLIGSYSANNKSNVLGRNNSMVQVQQDIMPEYVQEKKDLNSKSISHEGLPSNMNASLRAIGVKSGTNRTF